MTACAAPLEAFWANETDGEAGNLPLPPTLNAGDLAPAERIALGLINHAAEHGRPCPVNIDLEVAAGFNSSSMGAKLVRKLEHRGLIRVSRYQRFRLVEIVATGKTTARHPSMRGDMPLVRRGARAAAAAAVSSNPRPHAAH